MEDDSERAGFSSEAPPPAELAGVSYVRSEDRIIKLLNELGPEVTGESLALMPVLISYLKHDNPSVVRQSISSGTSLFCTALDVMILQFHSFGKVEGWLEEFWICMVNFLNAVRGLVLEPGSVVAKVLAVNFLKIFVLCITSDAKDNEVSHRGTRQKFNVAMLGSSHPVLNPSFLTSEANNVVEFLLAILQSVKTTNGSFIVTIINCLAAIARKRPVHYNRILSTFISFVTNFGTKKAAHSPSIQYSLRSASLGFSRNTHPSFIECTEKFRILLSMDFGEADGQLIQQMEKRPRNLEFVVPDSHYTFDPSSGAMAKRRRLSRPDNNDGEFKGDGEAVHGSEIHATEQMIAILFGLLAEAENGFDSLELVISNIGPDLMANIVIENMKNIPQQGIIMPC